MVLCFRAKLIDIIYRRPRKIENYQREGEKDLRKNSALCLVAILVAKILPAKKPAFHKMQDSDFITILSWLEDWEPEKVYKTAYRQSHLDTYYTWEEWAQNMKPLPVPVRAEMERAIKMHEESGNLEALRTYAFVYEILVEKWFPRLLWATFFLTILLTFVK